MMKKGFFIGVFFLVNFCAFSFQLPEKLEGLWEGKDRYVFFESSDSEQNENDNPYSADTCEIVIVLKEYYGWYYDRAAESQAHSLEEERIANAATHKEAEHIKIVKIDSLINQPEDNTFELPEDCAWELKFNFSKYQQNRIPVCVIDDNMYLNFYIKQPEWNENGKIIVSQNGQWKGNAVSRGITLNSQLQNDNIGLLVVDDNFLFDIRYWLSDMGFYDGLVKLRYKDKEYSLPKVIASCGQNYTCVSSFRSKKIRNVVEPFIYDADKWIYNDQKTLMAVNEVPYLRKLADKDTFAELIQIVKAANARRKPDPPPLFEEKELDWHWDMIDYLEKDNELIKQVRERQRNFGPRSKDRS